MGIRLGIGQDSHAFLTNKEDKACVIGGVLFEDVPGFDADSDGDVIFHAICQAITSLSHVSILGQIAPLLCREQGIKDSRVYLQKALATLTRERIEHVALSLEGKRPRFEPRRDVMRCSIAKEMGINISRVGITSTSGNGLTSFGQGKGVMCLCLLTVATTQSPK